MRIKRKKKQNIQHPDYLMGKQRTWVDKEREESGTVVRRNFMYILIFSAIILVVVIIAVTTAMFTSSTPIINTITAADTFAVSTVEQENMKELAQRFATGMILLAYSSDEEGALNGKNIALSCMAQNTVSYNQIENLSVDNGVIDSSQIIPVVSVPVLEEGTQSYAGAYTYTLAAIGKDSNENVLGPAYDFSLIFQLAEDIDGGESNWVITSATINRHS